jgi:hypothetical protein
MDMIIAAPGAATSIIGFVGFGGAAFAGTVYLGLGLWGGGKISFTHESAVASGFVTGQLWALAGEMWAFAGDMSGGLSQALAEAFGKGGEYGPAATAIVLALVAYGTKLRGPLAVALGLLMPPVFTAAGGLFSMLTDLITSGLTMVFG